MTKIGLQINTIIGRKIVNIFLSISLNKCFSGLKEPSHWGGSFEYPQHMFWLRNKKISYWLRTIIWMPKIESIAYASFF